ncbi:MAG: TMEM14 family protein [Parachlamydiaceae bacterium]
MTRNKHNLLALLLVYASILIVGGAFGHQSSSLVAIIASVLSGAVIFIGWWMVLHDKKYALLFNLVFVCGLTVFFTYRWFVIKKFYPPVFLLLISLALALKIGQAIVERKCKGFLN